MQKYKRKSRNHVVIFLQNILFCFTPKKKTNETNTSMDVFLYFRTINSCNSNQTGIITDMKYY